MKRLMMALALALPVAAHAQSAGQQIDTMQATISQNVAQLRGAYDSVVAAASKQITDLNKQVADLTKQVADLKAENDTLKKPASPNPAMDGVTIPAPATAASLPGQERVTKPN